MSKFAENESEKSGQHGDELAFYQREITQFELLTREGEAEFARRRDRGWAVARGFALASAAAGSELDRLIADRREMPDDEQLRHRRTRELEQLMRWRVVHRHGRDAVAARDWAHACAAADQLRAAVDSIPLSLRDWQLLVSRSAELLGEGLMLDEHEDVKLEQIEQRLGHPRWRWVDQCEDIITGERQAKEAMNEIVKASLRLVFFFGRRYQRQSMMPFSDLIQEGNLGLIIAAEKFEPCRGFRFASMAQWWIRQRITRSLSNHSRTVRIPIGTIDKLSKIKRVRAEYDAREQREPTAEELAKELEMSVKPIKFLLSINHKPLSLDDVSNEDDDERPLSEMLEDPGAVNPIEHAIELERMLDAQELLETLNDIEQQVLRLRFGFESAELTGRAVARELGMTLNRIREIEEEALLKLRAACRSARDGLPVSNPRSSSPTNARPGEARAHGLRLPP